MSKQDEFSVPPPPSSTDQAQDVTQSVTAGELVEGIDVHPLNSPEEATVNTAPIFTMTTPQATPSTPEEVVNIVCPRCGFDVRNSAAEPSETDKKAFLRSILGGTAFEKTYDLYDGSVQVVLQARMADQSTLIMDQLDHDQSLGRINMTNNAMKYLFTLSRYQLALAVTAVRRRGQDSANWPPVDVQAPASIYSTEGTTATLLEKIISVKFRNWPDPFMMSMLQLQQQFEKLVDTLSARVQHPDFWKGAGVV